MRTRCLATTVAALVLLAASAAEASDDDVLAHYDAYNAALAEGRFDNAIAEGEAAWRAAEAEWGDAPETAVLAYNLAALLERRDQARDALAPARRAHELAETGVGSDLTPFDTAIVLGLAESEQSNPRQGLARLEDVLGASVEPGDENDDLVFAAWIRLANGRADRNRRRDAHKAASRARQMAEAAQEPSWIQRAAVLEAQTAFVLGREDDARVAVDAGLNAYVDDLASIPSVDVLRLDAWRSLLTSEPSLHVKEDVRVAAVRIAQSANSRIRRGRVAEAPARPDMVMSADACGDWRVRTIPSYPAQAAADARESVLIVRYDLGEAGEVENVRLVAAAPGPRDSDFVAAVAAALGSWRKSLPVDANPSCRRDRLLQFRFVLLS